MTPVWHRGTPRRATLPPPGVLRRERRAVAARREEKLRHLGGLMLEMFRHDHFREDLVRDRCAELLELDGRLAELDWLLEYSRRRVPPVRCACGAPLVPGIHFCQNCGRPTPDAPVIACATCGHALPADAQFCPQCGTSAGALSDGASAPEADASPEQGP
jgi:Double zinc ribbon